MQEATARHGTGRQMRCCWLGLGRVVQNVLGILVQTGLDAGELASPGPAGRCWRASLSSLEPLPAGVSSLAGGRSTYAGWTHQQRVLPGVYQPATQNYHLAAAPLHTLLPPPLRLAAQARASAAHTAPPPWCGA